ncbi:unnamed protein product [Phytophthora lilii]|uniref:Unnamed protein product n=1 Tax=Phytophthora lilii TaxID=2077276 RepID=A0A9W6TIQ4_9STRA|nr:unnamed protein product [Phytophthora lilii]
MLWPIQQKSLSAQYPTQTEIRLGTDRIQRRKALLDVKARKLCEAKRFIRTWGQGLDTNSTFSQENQFEALDGGFSVIRFDNAPILGTTVKNVFDAIIHSMQNAEIMISEMFGSISIREDTDFNASDIFQIRLVSSTPRGAVVESNSVVFAEYVEGPEDTYGIIASDFVDADELYPYIPSERVRRDSVTIVLVRSVKTSDKQEVVVGTRWTCLNLAHTELDIPKEGIRELQETSMAWGDTVKKCIMQYIANNQKLG